MTTRDTSEQERARAVSASNAPALDLATFAGPGFSALTPMYQHLLDAGYKIVPPSVEQEFMCYFQGEPRFLGNLNRTVDKLSELGYIVKTACFSKPGGEPLITVAAIDPISDHWVIPALDPPYLNTGISSRSVPTNKREVMTDTSWAASPDEHRALPLESFPPEAPAILVLERSGSVERDADSQVLYSEAGLGIATERAIRKVIEARDEPRYPEAGVCHLYDVALTAAFMQDVAAFAERENLAYEEFLKPDFLPASFDATPGTPEIMLAAAVPCDPEGVSYRATYRIAAAGQGEISPLITKVWEGVGMLEI